MTARPILFLIDGSNQMYRAYHAIRGLSGPDGKSTNAVYGFVTMLRKLIADHSPAYIAASFDLAGPTFRDALVSDYKANRTPMPGDLAEQITWVHDACRAMGVPIVNAEGFEADDVIGTLATKAAAAGFDVAIVTGDKDFFQLVGGPIRVFNPRDEGAWFDTDGVLQKFGVRPDQVVDVLALMGDSIDNIKGVPGIGEKGARDLIAAHASLDALLDKAGEIPQKRYREALQTHADSARQSRELLRIRTDVPIPFDASAFTFAGRQPRALLRAVLAARFPLAADGVRADRGDDHEAVRPGAGRRGVDPSGGRGARSRTIRASRAVGRDQRDERADPRYRDRDGAANRVVHPGWPTRRRPARCRRFRSAARPRFSRRSARS